MLVYITSMSEESKNRPSLPNKVMGLFFGRRFIYEPIQTLLGDLSCYLGVLILNGLCYKEPIRRIVRLCG